MITVVIPARMASSRFPGKPLEPICGMPLVEHVRRRALLAPDVSHVVVATCDDEIRKAVLQFGGQAVMTKNTHERCTDRVEEAMQQLEGDIVVMVQGDEPLLQPEAIEQVSRPLVLDVSLQAVNLLSPLESEKDLANPDIVKAVCDLSGNVMFLTRASVPYFRRNTSVPVYRQTGIMAFRTEFLRKFSRLPETPLECAESIDMLRVLEHGFQIRGVVVDYSTQGVDRPSDITLVEAILARDAAQQALLGRIADGPEVKK